MSSPDLAAAPFRTADHFTLSDLDALRVVLRGTSVIDWHRLNYQTDEDLYAFLATHEFSPQRPGDVRRLEAIKQESIDYLRRKFEFPIPHSVEQTGAIELFRMAAGKGHKQVCACIILKTMHIIHHLQGRELLYMVPLSDAEVFQLVEEKVYRVVGGMLAENLPIVEFLGGRKNRDSLYTKLLSKTETIAAQIYDKLRFRIVTRSAGDLLPVMNYLTRRLVPFNYVIPGESKNTLIDFAGFCGANPNLASMVPYAQGSIEDATSALPDNKFSARTYRVLHFVVDLPVRVPEAVIARAPAVARTLGPVVFVLTEFQVVDQETDHLNETGEASHAQYKERQRKAVMERLRMGFRRPAPPDDSAPRRAIEPLESLDTLQKIVPAPPEPPAETPRRRTSRPPRKSGG